MKDEDCYWAAWNTSERPAHGAGCPSYQVVGAAVLETEAAAVVLENAGRAVVDPGPDVRP